MKQPQALLFDFDETLVTLDMDWPRARRRVREFFLPYGFNSTFRPLTESLHAALEFCDAAGRAELYRQALSILHEEECAGLTGAVEMPGAREVFSLLVARQIPFGIVSNNDSAVIGAALDQFALPRPVVIVGRDSVRRLKPDPEGGCLALERLGVSPGDCWFVGNSEYDLALGRALDMQTFIIEAASPSRDGAITLQSLLELTRWLEEKE